jgi:hypothetical protein
MIWAGAGVLGVILAFLMIPWGSLTIDSSDQTPTVQAPRDRATRTIAEDDGLDPAEVASVTPSTPAPDIGAPPGVVPGPPAPLSDATPGSWVNPGREARNELLKRPDMVLVRTAESRWRSLSFVIADLPHDGAADHTMNRIEVLRQDLAAYRRSPDDYNMDELIDRQRNILSELKQTSYWVPEVRENETRLMQAIQDYSVEMNAPE